MGVDTSPELYYGLYFKNSNEVVEWLDSIDGIDYCEDDIGLGASIDDVEIDIQNISCHSEKGYYVGVDIGHCKSPSEIVEECKRLDGLIDTSKFSINLFTHWC